MKTQPSTEDANKAATQNKEILEKVNRIREISDALMQATAYVVTWTDSKTISQAHRGTPVEQLALNSYATSCIYKTVQNQTDQKKPS